MNDKKCSESTTAQVAIQMLRSASENIPSERKEAQIKKLLKGVKTANETIDKCEQSFQKQAEMLNVTIAHSVTHFADKEIVKLEREVRGLVKFDPADYESIEAGYQALLSLKERLLDIFELISSWGWRSYMIL